MVFPVLLTAIFAFTLFDTIFNKEKGIAAIRNFVLHFRGSNLKKQKNSSSTISIWDELSTVLNATPHDAGDVVQKTVKNFLNDHNIAFTNITGPNVIINSKARILRIYLKKKKKIVKVRFEGIWSVEY